MSYKVFKPSDITLKDLNKKVWKNAKPAPVVGHNPNKLKTVSTSIHSKPPTIPIPPIDLDALFDFTKPRLPAPSLNEIYHTWLQFHLIIEELHETGEIPPVSLYELLEKSKNIKDFITTYYKK